ncbi:MAG: efflux RND transporter permease subunit, partial [Thermoanaerobaculia bacterium]|nr:efflux RND transporter permease subunit [Thermoanaerobaculia bacterium]
MTPESVAALATRRPVAVTVVALAVALVGWLSWRQLPLDLLPDLQSPTVVVSVRSGDRPPTEMERLYGEQVEQRLFTVRGIREVSQVARTGRLIATVVFDWDADLDLGLVEVQKAVGPIEADPEVDEVLVRRFDPRQAPILTMGLVAPGGQPDLAELRRLARRQVAPALEQLPGVAEVRVTGGREKEVRVLVDRYRLDAFDVSLERLESRLAAENVDISAGTLEEGNQVYLVRGLARYRRPEDVADVVARYTEDETGRRQAVRVSDLGTVELVDREIDHLVRVDGVEGVGLSIYKEAGANTVAVSTTVQEAMEGLADDLPSVEVHLIADDAALVVDALADLQTAAGFGILLAVIVLAVFLRSAGATLIVSAAVPVSIFAALFLMRFGGQSLNIVTLGGLALGAGMLVDNAIVVVESIYRRLAAGDAPALAAARGTGQVAGAITASTLTTCVVFLPVLFVQGLAARLIEGIAFTVVVSLAASLAVAIFLIPALGRWFLPGSAGSSPEVEAPGARGTVERLVARLLGHPWPVVLAAAALAAVAAVSLLRLGTELLPPADPRQFSVRLVGPSGQRVESTGRAGGGLASRRGPGGGGRVG